MIWGIITMNHTYNPPNAYSYGGNGIYYNDKGDVVPFDEVLNNYLILGSTYVSLNNNPFGVADAMKDGWRFYNVQAFNNNHVMFVKGDLGSISPSANGGITFSNPTASVTFINDWGFKEGSGETSWSDVDNGIGSFDVVNGFKTELLNYTVRNSFKTATSWGQFSNLRATQKAWRITNTFGKEGATYLKFAEGLGYVGAGLTTTYSIVNAYNYYNNGGRDWEVLAKSSLDVVMTGVGFLGPIGFGISASYFVIDAATGGFGEIKQ
jgi:hypothetical protein